MGHEVWTYDQVFEITVLVMFLLRHRLSARRGGANGRHRRDDVDLRGPCTDCLDRDRTPEQPSTQESPMPFRFITKSIHAYLIDYPVAIVLIAAPFVLKLGQSGPIAMWLSVVVGIAALLLAALTDHPTGLVRIIPYWLHLWVDRAVGVLFVIAPLAFKFTGLDAWYYWVLAAAVLLTTSVFNAPEEPVAAHSALDTRTA
jgi:hypothetical protein